MNDVNDDSTQDIALTPSEMLDEARQRLRAALEMLGRYQESVLTDSSLRGAAILAADASQLFAEIVRRRTSSPRSD